MVNPSSIKLSVKIDGESQEDCSDSKLEPLHFQIKKYYLSDANFQTDNVLGSISAVSRSSLRMSAGSFSRTAAGSLDGNRA